MRSSRWLSVLLCSAALTGCDPRPDDSLEPNDDLAHATHLVLGQYVDGRANQGNRDVFYVDTPAGETLFFALKDRGLEDCAGFIVETSETGVLYDDASGYCDYSDPVENGAVMSVIEGFGHEIEVPQTIAGRYYLTILEGSMADNIAPLSWDYSVRASFDESVASR